MAPGWVGQYAAGQTSARDGKLPPARRPYQEISIVINGWSHEGLIDFARVNQNARSLSEGTPMTTPSRRMWYGMNVVAAVPGGR